MKNLAISNIYRYRGEIPKKELSLLESNLYVRFHELYFNFIVKHNGARLNNGCFNFYDNSHKRVSSESLAFLNVCQIQEDIDSLLKQSTDDPNDSDVFKFYKYFDKKLIPFGETGGGDFICFDYRNHDGDNPPIVLWIHDIPEKRISFIANNFEEFINMLHEPED
jgi:hypothetical protein